MAWKFDCQRLVLARQARDLTQEDMSERIGITKQQLSAWETGSVTPGQESLVKVCNALNTPPKFFFVNCVNDDYHAA